MGKGRRRPAAPPAHRRSGPGGAKNPARPIAAALVRRLPKSGADIKELK
jgi:short subunit dehydrogenase-like uncharacterized protein